MKSPYLKSTSALAVLALAVIGCQSAFGGEEKGGSESAPASPRAAAAQWKVAYASKSFEATLTDVVALSADEGWAVGRASDTTGEAGSPVLLHRTGGKWKESDLPPGLPTKSASLDEVAASGPDDVWVFGQQRGDEPKALAYRWDGEQWRKATAPPLELGTVTSSAVFGADDAWALGGDSAWHWNGTAWSAADLPAHATALSGTGPDDLWAVGFRDTEGNVLNQPAAMHWDGSAWKLEETPEYHFPDPAPPEESASLDSVTAVSANEVWAVGNHTFNHGEGGEEPAEENILLRWDGKQWKKLPADATAKASLQAAPDGDGGLVLSRSWHLTKDGALEPIAKHDPVPGRTGQVTDVDKKQVYYPERAVLVPGGHEVWSVGLIELGAHGDANFRRSSVLSYSAG